jgi:hypothetical protein
VIGQESQICPAFILKIADDERLANALDAWTREIDAFEEKMQLRNRIVSPSSVAVSLSLRGMSFLHSSGVTSLFFFPSSFLFSSFFSHS